MEHRSIKSIMLHANDPGQHTVCWSELGQCWLVENPKDGLVQSCKQLCDSLGNLHWRSDRSIAAECIKNKTNIPLTRDESILRVATHWTITENPYV